MIRVFRDNAADAVIIDVGADGAGGMRFNNELRAVGNGDGTCDILNPPRSTENVDFAELSGIPFATFVDESGTALGASEEETCDVLNAILRSTGGATGLAPTITSELTITVSDGDPINYTLDADYGVGYEWDNLPAGLTIKNGNYRKLIGTITAGPGTYTPTMTATNYYGQDTETLTINVVSVFANTKSVDFDNRDYLQANNASLLSGSLGRPGNGAGSSDAWTIHCWFKAGTSGNSKQTILYYGGNSTSSENHIRLYWNGDSASRQQIVLEYGTLFNNLEFESPVGSVSSSSGWHHIMVCYDGGTTGNSSGSVNDYYSRFSMFIDGASVTTSNSNTNYGTTGALPGDVFRVGRYSFSDYMRNNCIVDELAVWGSDQSANVAAIYNLGSPHDLSSLGTAPDHWWRMGDGDTYPNIQDNIGTADLRMYNMTAADIVNIVP